MWYSKASQKLAKTRVYLVGVNCQNKEVKGHEFELECGGVKGVFVFVEEEMNGQG